MSIYVYMISRLYSRIVLPVVFSSSSGFCRWRCRVWILGAALACLNTCMSSWKSKGTPLCHPSQEIRPYQRMMVGKKSLNKALFSGWGVTLGGDALRFPWLPVTSPQAVHQAGADDMTIVTWTNHYMWWWTGWKGVVYGSRGSVWWHFKRYQSCMWLTFQTWSKSCG